jgi:hypothetical protein
MSPVFRVFYLLLIMAGCCTTKADNLLNNMPQGIKGYVTELVGDQMPGPGKEKNPGKPLATTIYVYEATSVNQVDRKNDEPYYSAIRTKFVKSFDSDKDGFFAADLLPGKYSLFTKVDGKFFASVFDGDGTIAPVLVEENKITGVNIVVNAKATY